MRPLRCKTEPGPSFERRHRDIVVKASGDVYEGDQMIAKVKQENGETFIGLGKEEDQLHINIMMPTSKGDKSELSQMVASYLARYTDVKCEASKLEDWFKEDQRARMRRFRLAVEFQSVSSSEKTVIYSSVIRDKSLLPRFQEASPLKCCLRGGRKVFMFSKVVYILLLHQEFTK